MSTKSQKRRLARRHVARVAIRPIKHGFDGRPNATCARCSVKLGRGQIGALVTFTQGVFAKRNEFAQGRMCGACAYELRREKCSQSKMHGLAYRPPAPPNLALPIADTVPADADPWLGAARWNEASNRKGGAGGSWGDVERAYRKHS